MSISNGFVRPHRFVLTSLTWTPCTPGKRHNAGQVSVVAPLRAFAHIVRNGCRQVVSVGSQGIHKPTRTSTARGDASLVARRAIHQFPPLKHQRRVPNITHALRAARSRAELVESRGFLFERGAA